MRKTISIIVFMFFMVFGYAQTTKTLSLQKFTELKVYDRISVNLIKSDKNMLVVTGEDKEDITITENTGTLKIRMNIKEFLSGNQLIATLYFTEDLTLIDTNENAKITTSKPIKSVHLEVRAQEAGIIELPINTEYVSVKSTTGSEITLTGTTRVQEVSVNTGGKVFNKDLTTKETTVTVLAGGNAAISASDKVNARVKAGGSIMIYGNPKNLSTDDTFGGTIKVMN